MVRNEQTPPNNPDRVCGFSPDFLTPSEAAHVECSRHVFSAEEIAYAFSSDTEWPSIKSMLR